MQHDDQDPTLKHPASPKRAGGPQPDATQRIPTEQRTSGASTDAPTEEAFQSAKTITDGAPLAASGATGSSLVGRRIGPYQVIRKVGQGGMGMVFEAYEPSLDRKVAIKVLPQQLAADGEWVERFLREARTAAALDHPSICSIYACDQTADGVCYIAMQYIEGMDLGSWLRAEPLPISVALKITREVAVALQAAHSAGVVHRDIKPDNLRIEPSGRAMVMDFGLAKGAGKRGGRQDMRITDAGTFLGTPEYSSPEQCESGQIDHRSDLYSLGVCLYEMVSGHVPHRAETPYKLFRKIIEEQPLPVRELDASIPKAVARVIERLLAKDPADRFQSGDELVAELDRLVRADQVDLAAYGREIAARRASDTTAATVALAPGESEVSDRPTTRATEAASRRTRRTFADKALRSGPSPALTIGLLVTVLMVGVAAVANMPGGQLLPVVEAKATAPLARPLPRIDPNRVVIFGFVERAASGDAGKMRWMRSALAEMLTVNLMEIESLQVIGVEEGTRALEAAGGDEERAARELGAGRTLRGTFFADPTGNVTLVARLKAFEGGRLENVRGVKVSGELRQFMAAVNKMSAELIELFGPKLTSRETHFVQKLEQHQVDRLAKLERSRDEASPSRSDVSRDRQSERKRQDQSDRPSDGDDGAVDNLRRGVGGGGEGGGESGGKPSDRNATTSGRGLSPAELAEEQARKAEEQARKTKKAEREQLGTKADAGPGPGGKADQENKDSDLGDGGAQGNRPPGDDARPGNETTQSNDKTPKGGKRWNRGEREEPKAGLVTPAKPGQPKTKPEVQEKLAAKAYKQVQALSAETRVLCLQYAAGPQRRAGADAAQLRKDPQAAAAQAQPSAPETEVEAVKALSAEARSNLALRLYFEARENIKAGQKAEAMQQLNDAAILAPKFRRMVESAKKLAEAAKRSKQHEKTPADGEGK